MWQNYRELGYRRLVYTNTVSILEVAALTAAMGGAAEVTSVLLRAGDAAVTERLGVREHGASLDRHLERGAVMADHLDRSAGEQVHRLDTEGGPRVNWPSGSSTSPAGWGPGPVGRSTRLGPAQST